MRALVAAGDDRLGRFLADFVRQQGCDVLPVTGLPHAVQVLAGEGELDLAIIDLDLRAEGGFRLLEWLRARFPGIRVVAVVRHQSVTAIVRAVKLGAEDVVPDPAEDVLPLQFAVARATEARLGGGEGADVASLAASVGLVLGVNPEIWRLAAVAVRVARHPLTVVIQGETGSGKELFARLIHAASPRATGRLVDVNCGAVPPDLLASELFGHEQGAFTGARRDRRGLFELADGGTLFQCP